MSYNIYSTPYYFRLATLITDALSSNFCSVLSEKPLLEILEGLIETFSSIFELVDEDTELTVAAHYNYKGS